MAMLDLLARMRELLLNPPQPPFDKVGSLSVPDAFNIGINDGAAAGQTVLHPHIHLIPRYSGDTAVPRGGVRWTGSCPRKRHTGRRNEFGLTF
jgi:diadenosine tetraphosphate (Ap4A) HIT family hydrolase